MVEVLTLLGGRWTQKVHDIEDISADEIVIRLWIAVISH